MNARLYDPTRVFYSRSSKDARTNGKFANGAVTGAFVHLFNSKGLTIKQTFKKLYIIWEISANAFVSFCIRVYLQYIASFTTFAGFPATMVFSCV